MPRRHQGPRAPRTTTTQARTDLTDARWAILQPMLPAPPGGGRPRTTDPREVLDAIAYVLRTGCAWDFLPHDFPPPGTVYGHFGRWRRDGTITRIHEALRPQVRQASEHDEAATAACRDSQPVKTTEVGGVKGFDTGKKVKGRKRPLLVDGPGLPIAVVVSSANVQDCHGAKPVLSKAKGRAPRLRVVWADGIREKRSPIDRTRSECGWELRAVKRTDKVKGSEVSPKRRVVERTFGWLGRYRRLGKDYERLTEASGAMVELAMIHIMVRRLEPTCQNDLAPQKAGSVATQAA